MYFFLFAGLVSSIYSLLPLQELQGLQEDYALSAQKLVDAMNVIYTNEIRPFSDAVVILWSRWLE